MKSVFRTFAVGVVLVSLGHPAADAGVVGSAQANGNGTYTYSYTVDNTGGTFDVFAWSLEFNIPVGQIDWNQLDQAGGGDVVVPNADWIAQAGVPTLGGLSAQDFFSLDPLADVLIGNKLTGFSFVSAFPPVQTVYTLEFGALGDSITGTTVGPGRGSTGVPDSGTTWLLFALGAVGVGGLRRRS